MGIRCIFMSALSIGSGVFAEPATSPRTGHLLVASRCLSGPCQSGAQCGFSFSCWHFSQPWPPNVNKVGAGFISAGDYFFFKVNVAAFSFLSMINWHFWQTNFAEPFTIGFSGPLQKQHFFEFPVGCTTQISFPCSNA